MADGEMVVAGENGEIDAERARAAIEACTDVNELIELKTVAETAAFYRQRRGEGVSSINEALALVLRAQRRLGEFLVQAPLSKGGRPRKKPVTEGTGSLKLSDLGVTKKESARCQQLARVDEPVFEQHLIAVQAKGERLTTSGTIAATSEGADYDSDEWYTPSAYVDVVRRVLGGIDLDPASCEHAQRTVQAAKYFTKADDGLSQAWGGRVFLNPPFSQPLAADFSDKLIEEHRAGNVPAAIMLQNAQTDTAWFHRIAEEAWICIVKGRISFDRIDGAGKANRNSQVFFYLGPDAHVFAEEFRRFGLVGKLTGGGPTAPAPADGDEPLDDGVF